ncbi:thiolase family protein [Nocardia sp. NPDC004123]
MPDAAIYEPLHTPIGRFVGVFKDIAPETPAATLIAELLKRTGVDGSDVDDVILGQASPNGAAPTIRRVAVLDLWNPHMLCRRPVTRPARAGFVLDSFKATAQLDRTHDSPTVRSSTRTMNSFVDPRY